MELVAAGADGLAAALVAGLLAGAFAAADTDPAAGLDDGGLDGTGELFPPQPASSSVLSPKIEANVRCAAKPRMCVPSYQFPGMRFVCAPAPAMKR